MWGRHIKSRVENSIGYYKMGKRKQGEVAFWGFPKNPVMGEGVDESGGNLGIGENQRKPGHENTAGAGLTEVN